MKCLMILPALALAGCDAPDGYRFERAEYRAATVQVSIVEHSSLGELQLWAADAGADVGEGREVQAFSVISSDRRRCTVHIIAPQIDYQPQWLGHEVAHCIYGRWHA